MSRKLKYTYDINVIQHLTNETDPPRPLADVARILQMPPETLRDMVARKYRRKVVFEVR